MAKIGQIVCALFAACCFLGAAAVPVVTQWALATGPKWVRFPSGEWSGTGLVISAILTTIIFIAAGIATLVNTFE